MLLAVSEPTDVFQVLHLHAFELVDDLGVFKVDVVLGGLVFHRLGRPRQVHVKGLEEVGPAEFYFFAPVFEEIVLSVLAEFFGEAHVLNGFVNDYL